MKFTESCLKETVWSRLSGEEDREKETKDVKRCKFVITDAEEDTYQVEQPMDTEELEPAARGLVETDTAQVTHSDLVRIVDNVSGRKIMEKWRKKGKLTRYSGNSLQASWNEEFYRVGW